MSVFGQVAGGNPFGRGETTVDTPRRSSEVCFEFNALRKLDLTMTVMMIRDNLTGDLNFKIQYIGKVQEESYKSCIDKNVADSLSSKPCESKFNVKSVPTVSWGVPPVLIPFGKFFKVKKFLPNGVIRRFRGRPSQTLLDPLVAQHQSVGGTAINLSPKGSTTELWQFMRTATNKEWNWTNIVPLDLGKTVTIFQFEFWFDIECKNNECWKCKPAAHDTTEAPPVFGETTVAVKPCHISHNSNMFDGELEFDISNEVANNTPHFYQKKVFTRVSDGGNGLVVPTSSGWSSRIFDGPVGDKILAAIGGLNQQPYPSTPVEFCADMEPFSETLDKMKAAWEESESPLAPGGGFGEGT